ncbi:hypothetical protein GCM10029964_057750 [Kibdelosporangium lantanae]
MAEQGLLGGIGWTRAVRVDGLTGPADAEVWVKLEAANPTGSYKDRMALAMVRGAERSGSCVLVRWWWRRPAGVRARRWAWCARSRVIRCGW